jgi:hypothetical protein
MALLDSQIVEGVAYRDLVTKSSASAVQRNSELTSFGK